MLQKKRKNKTKQNLGNKILGKLVENSEYPRHALYGTWLSELFTPEPYKYRGKKNYFAPSKGDSTKNKDKKFVSPSQIQLQEQQSLTDNQQ